MIIGTSATLCVGRPFVFFCAKLRIRQQEAEDAITLKQLKVRTLNLKLRWGTYESFFVQNLGAINHVIRISEPKTKMPSVGLNNFSSKANRTRGKSFQFRKIWASISASKNKL